MIPLENISNIIALLIAATSLLISIIALKIAQRTFIYSSKDYIPKINFTILENDTLEIINRSNKLYNIEYINFLKTETIGFEDRENNTIVEIPFIVKSIMYRWIKKAGKTKKVIINSNLSGPCAYICPYDIRMVNLIKSKIDLTYSTDSKKGYTLPSLQSHSYIIEIGYTNSFLERKSLIFLQEHIHGYGYDKKKIGEEMLNQILNKLNIPKYKNIDELWNYLIKKYSIPFNQYFGK